MPRRDVSDLIDRVVEWWDSDQVQTQRRELGRRWVRRLTGAWYRWVDYRERWRQRVRRWRRSAGNRIDQASRAVSAGRVAPYLALAIGVAVIVVAGFRVMLGMLGSGGLVGWVGIAIVGLVAVILQVFVLHNLITSFADSRNRRPFFLALFASFSAAVLTVEFFAALVAQLSWLDLWPAEQALLWNLADSVPLLELTGRLGWTAPELPDSISGRILLLSFMIVVIAPIARLLIALFFAITASVPTRTGRVRYARWLWWLMAATLGGLAWATIGPGTHIWTEVASRSGDAKTELIWSVVGAAALGLGVAGVALVLVGVIVGGVWRFFHPIFPLVLPLVLLWAAPGRHVLLPWADPFNTVDRVVASLVAAVLIFTLIRIDRHVAYLPAGFTLVAAAVLVVVLGQQAPGTAWVVEAVTWRPWDVEIGVGLATAAQWASVGLLVIALRGLLAYTRGSELPDSARTPGRILLEGALAATRLVIIAAGILVGLQSVGWLPLAVGEDHASSLTALAGLSWHALDSIPGPDIPGILDWELAHDLTGPGIGPFILGLVLALVVMVGFPVVRDLLAWGRVKAGPPTFPIIEINTRLVGNLRDGLAILRGLGGGANGRRARSRRPLRRVGRLIDAARPDEQQLKELLGPFSPTAAAASTAVDRVSATLRSVAGRRPPGDTAVVAGTRAADRFADHAQLWRDHLNAIESLAAPARSRAVVSMLAAFSLPPAEMARLRELGIFAESEAIPVDLIAKLWHGHLAEDKAHALRNKFERLGLLILASDAPPRVRIPTAVHGQLRAGLGDRSAQTHAALLDEVAAELPMAEPLDESLPAPTAAWWELPGGYLADHLVEHLIAAGLPVDALVTDLRWVARRLREHGPAAPIADLAQSDSDRARTLAVAIGQCAHLVPPGSGTGVAIDVLATRLRDEPQWSVGALAARDQRLRPRWPARDIDPAVHRVLTGHETGIYGLTWLPDGRHLVTAGRDATVRIWDVASGKVFATITGHHQPADGEVPSVAWSPDGQHLAVSDRYGSIEVRRVSTGEQTGWLTGRPEAWSPDGQHIAVSDRSLVLIRDSTTNRVAHRLTQPDRVTAVHWSLDGRYLAAATDEVVHVWDLNVPGNAHEFPSPGRTVRRLRWSPDGRLLAASSSGREVTIWDLDEKEVVATAVAASDRPRAVEWSPDGGHLAIASDSTLLIWDIASRGAVARLTGHRDMIRALSWSPDGRYLASGGDDETVRVWQVAAALSDDVSTNTVRWSPDGRHIATGGDDGTVRVWDVTSGELLWTIPGEDSVGAVAWSPDGGRLAVAAAGPVVRIFDTGDLSVVITLPDFFAYHYDNEWVYELAWSPDGSYLVTCVEARRVYGRFREEDGYQESIRVYMWEADGGNFWELLYGGSRVSVVAWSPDGRRLITAESDDTVWVWDRPWHRETARLIGHPDWVSALGWALDDTSLSGGRSVALWKAVSRWLAAFRSHTDWTWTADGWNPTDRRRRKDPRRLRLSTGQQLVWNDHSGWTSAIALSPDGRHLAAVGYDGTVRVRELATSAVVAQFRLDALLWDCAWSPDGRGLAVAGGSGVHLFTFEATADAAVSAPAPGSRRA